MTVAVQKFKRELYDQSTDGYIQVLTIENGSVIAKSLRYKDLDNIDDYIGEKDIYITPNTMYKPQRRVSNIRQFRALYQDIDIIKKGLDKAEAVYLIWDLYHAKKIPMPTFIIDSGRGLHVYWKIYNAPYAAVSMWQELQDYLYYQLKDLGADKNSIDGARVLRLPGTINSKSNTECKLIESTLEFSNGITYSMYDLKENYLEKYKTKFNKVKSKKSSKVISNKLFNSYSLHFTRAEDLVKLCDLRKYNVKGYRNMIIHCYAYWVGIYERESDILESIVIELNNKFKEPLKSTEVRTVIRSVDKAVEKFIAYEQGIRNGEDKRVTKGMRDKKGYWYKNETLIERLDITVEEQRELKTIIGTRVKYDRNNIKRTPRNEEGFTKKQQELQDLKVKVVELKEEGLSLRKIAESLNITLGKVQRVLKK